MVLDFSVCQSCLRRERTSAVIYRRGNRNCSARHPGSEPGREQAALGRHPGEHAKSWEAGAVGVGCGLTGRGRAGGEAGVAGGGRGGGGGGGGDPERGGL